MATINGIILDDLIEKFDHMLTAITKVVEEAHDKEFVKVADEKWTKHIVELLRETESGKWELFDPPDIPIKS